MALAEFRAGQDLGLQFVMLAEEQAFADADLASGTNQAFPIVGLGGELARQQNFDAAVEEITRRGIARADRLSASAFATAIEAGGKDASVVEDDQIAGPQQVGKVAEQAVGLLAAGSLQMQHAGSVAGGERFLGNEFVGKMEVEVGNQHGCQIIGGMPDSAYRPEPSGLSMAFAIICCRFFGKFVCLFEPGAVLCGGCKL